MLRNHLMTLLSEKDNDTVAVDVNGILIDVDAVTIDRGCIVLVLNPEDMQGALGRMSCPDRPAASKETSGDASAP